MGQESEGKIKLNLHDGSKSYLNLSGLAGQTIDASKKNNPMRFKLIRSVSKRENSLDTSQR